MLAQQAVLVRESVCQGPRLTSQPSPCQRAVVPARRNGFQPPGGGFSGSQHAFYLDKLENEEGLCVSVCESMHVYVHTYVWCVYVLVQVPKASHRRGNTLPLTLAPYGHLNTTAANTLLLFQVLWVNDLSRE